MSDLLNSASLVMIPSGYKEDVVYSQIPTDGSGDLSFTRASNGTRINSAGLVEVCPWNLCTYSEELNIWTTERASVTTNATTAPNGTTTADKVITDSTANNTHQIYIGPFTTQNLPMVISCYAKKSEYNYIHLGAGGATTKTWFNLNDGTVGTQSSDVLSASIENVGNGWYRCINVINNTSTSNYVEFGPASVDGSRVISGTPSGGIFAWGAQLNIGSTAKPYFPTTDRLNVPRLTYQNGGGGCPSVLLEKQSTNLITYSEQFDNAAWSKSNVTITSNDAISPDGTQNADKFILNATTSAHIIYQAIANQNSGYYTVSCYVKYGNVQYFFTRSQTGGSVASVQFYDLQNGVVVGGSSDASITSVGNGWYRITLKCLSSNSTDVQFIVHGFSTASNLESCTSDGSLYGYIWGAQAEASSYPTSYIPTTSASATRVADACFKTGISSLIGGGTGTWFMDFEMVEGNLLQFAFNLSDGTDTNHLYLYYNSSSWYFGGFDTAVTLPSTLRKKVAVKYSSGTAKLFCNGSAITSLTISTAFSRLDLGNRFSQNYPMDGKINEAYFLTTSLTDAECQAITTI